MSNEPRKELLQNIINFFNQGDFKKALSEIKDLITVFPNSALSYNILGSIQMSLNDLDKAEKSFKKAIYLKNDYHHAINNLGLIFYRKEDYKKAIIFFEKASYLDKNYIEPLLNLSAIYNDTYKFNEAKMILDKIINLNPNMHEAYYNLAKTYIKLGEVNLSIENLKKAISIDSKQLNYLKDLGNIYLQKGEFEIGLNYLKDYLKIFPNSTEVYFYISLIKKFKKNDEMIRSVFNINENDLSENQKTYLFFTYGKIFSDLDDYEKSFFYYKKANSIKNESSPFNIENEVKLLPILKNHFQKNTLEKVNFKNERSIKTKIPIFIVGMPRSGTSLIDQILSKHSDIKAFGELEFLGDEINNLNIINSEFTETKANLLNKNYLNKINKENLKSTFFTDKTPINFRWIGYILHAFPNVKIIHIQRNAKATCWSNFKSNFSGEANNFSNSLENIVAYYKLYEKTMSFYNSVFEDKIYNIIYEDLVNDLEKNIKKLMSYLDLKWDKNCLNFHEGDRYVSTTSFAQVKKKIYNNSSSQWENYAINLNKYFRNLE